MENYSREKDRGREMVVGGCREQAMGVINGCSSLCLSLENHSSAVAGTSLGFLAELELEESPCPAGMDQTQAVLGAQGSGLQKAGANMLI